MTVGPTPEKAFSEILATGGRRAEIYRGLRSLSERYAELIRARYPRIPRRVSGYNLDSLLPEYGFDIARSLVGSEGTLVTVLEASCRLVDAKPCRTVVVAGFQDVFHAADQVPAVLALRPIALEGLDDIMIENIRRKGVQTEDLTLLPEGNGWLLVEVGSDGESETGARTAEVVAALGRLPGPPRLRILRDKDKPLLGKACVPDDSPYTTGGIGLLGTAPSEEALAACDTLLMIGTSFPYIEFFPKPGHARAVQIDANPARIGLRCPVEVGLVGDSKRTLEALLPLLHRNDHREFLSAAQEGMKNWWERMRQEGERQSSPMKPQVVAWELGKRLASDAIVSCDSGTITTWWARQILARRGQLHSCSGNLASMACGLPYAIAAQIAYPGRQSVAFVGDGTFSMLMAEFSTCVKYKLPVKIFVIKNNTLGQIKWEQMVFLGNPEYGCELEPINFAAFARSCGGMGYRIDQAKDCPEIVQNALNDPAPAVIECVVDPLEPPMPGRIKAKQAAHLAEALIRGEPNREKIAWTIAGDIVRQLI